MLGKQMLGKKMNIQYLCYLPCTVVTDSNIVLM